MTAFDRPSGLHKRLMSRRPGITPKEARSEETSTRKPSTSTSNSNSTSISTPISTFTYRTFTRKLSTYLHLLQQPRQKPLLLLPPTTVTLFYLISILPTPLFPKNFNTKYFSLKSSFLSPLSQLFMSPPLFHLSSFFLLFI